MRHAQLALISKRNMKVQAQSSKAPLGRSQTCLIVLVVAIFNNNSSNSNSRIIDVNNNKRTRPKENDLMHGRLH